MKQHRWMIVLLGILVLLLLLYTVTFAVPNWKLAVVSTFGKAAEPIEGRRPGQAGLHFKLPWPIQQVTPYDGRIFIFDDTHEQLQTADNLNVLITVYCGWRIDKAGLFYRTLETEAAAESTLRDIVRNKKSDVVGNEPLSAFVNTEPKMMRIEQIEKAIRDAVQKEVGPKYGIDVVTLGIKSLGLPTEVTKTVIESMKTERNRFAESHRSQGRAEADAIRERAKAARVQILAFADAKAKRIRAQGKEAAAEKYKEYRQNEAFAIFLKELECDRETLRVNTTILADERILRAFGFFRDGPSLPPLEKQSTQAQADKNQDK